MFVDRKVKLGQELRCRGLVALRDLLTIVSIRMDNRFDMDYWADPAKCNILLFVLILRRVFGFENDNRFQI